MLRWTFERNICGLQVCIVHRKMPRSMVGTLRRRRRTSATPKYFAMKYVNKRKCIAAHSAHNVVR